mmetsp:Transcript_28047/g.63524  ORF Transcript_28047/g.63524 Transcript_28047/m.63524 type:complete len:293 (+) Transcript_28047:289-1167(+)
MLAELAPGMSRVVPSTPPRVPPLPTSRREKVERRASSCPCNRSSTAHDTKSEQVISSMQLAPIFWKSSARSEALISKFSSRDLLRSRGGIFPSLFWSSCRKHSWRSWTPVGGRYHVAILRQTLWIRVAAAYLLMEQSKWGSNARALLLTVLRIQGSSRARAALGRASGSSKFKRALRKSWALSGRQVNLGHLYQDGASVSVAAVRQGGWPVRVAKAMTPSEKTSHFSVYCCSLRTSGAMKLAVPGSPGMGPTPLHEVELPKSMSFSWLKPLEYTKLAVVKSLWMMGGFWLCR